MIWIDLGWSPGSKFWETTNFEGRPFQKMLQGGEKVSHSWKLLPSNWRIWSHPRFVVGDNFYKPVSNLVYLPRASKVHANLSYLVTSKTKITRASFLACQTAPLHRKNIHGKDVSNKSISEKPRHSPTTKKRKRSHSWSESSIAGWKCPPFPNVFPLFKKEDYNCYG